MGAMVDEHIRETAEVLPGGASSSAPTLLAPGDEQRIALDCQRAPAAALRGELVEVHGLIAPRLHRVPAPLSRHDGPISTDQHPNAGVGRRLRQAHRDLYSIKGGQQSPRRTAPSIASMVQHRRGLSSLTRRQELQELRSASFATA